MRGTLLLSACLLGASLSARCAELVVMVDSTANMPMARVEGGQLVDGVHKEIGEILARHMGRQVRFEILPRKRLEAALQELRGEPIGTILGYYHPEMDAILGKDFVRDNAPNMESNMQKLRLGRVRHILITQVVLDYYQRIRQPPLAIHPPLTVVSWQTRCAVSRKGHVPLKEIDRAIAQAVKDGSLARMLLRFR